MKNNKTIIYYSSNAETPEFEQLIIEDLKKKAGNIPIISVTRKPIDLGTNICIGEKEICYVNGWRQLLLGLKTAKTKFCITAESDCIYPENYFQFNPPKNNEMYYYDNVWVVWKRHNGFWKKSSHCEGAEICGREYWISKLEPLLGDGWEPKTKNEERALVKKFFAEDNTFTGDPVVSFKTGNGVSNKTGFINKKNKDILYWGNIDSIKDKYFNYK